MSSNEISHDVITIGETMWRLSPPGYTRLDVTRSLDVNIGGAESNLAIALARLGKKAAWWSRLPDSAPGRHIAQVLQTYGVDTSGIYWQPGARLGTYFVEFGSPPRPTQVIYDRANSAASQMQPDDFDWSRLRHARCLHLTGITPALSPSCLATVRRAIKAAHAADILFTFDINYRAKLWDWDTARPIMDELAAQADFVFCAVRDARQLLQHNAAADEIAQQLHQRWQGPTVFVTNGGENSLACAGDQVVTVPTFPVTVVDRVGAGDAFAAGVLTALLDCRPLAEAVRFGNATAALKMTVASENTLITRDEVEALLAQTSSGDIQR